MILKLAVILFVIILLGCSPTTQVICGKEGTHGTLSNVEVPTVDILEDPRVNVQSPGGNQSGDQSDIQSDNTQAGDPT